MFTKSASIALAGMLLTACAAPPPAGSQATGASAAHADLLYSGRATLDCETPQCRRAFIHAFVDEIGEALGANRTEQAAVRTMKIGDKSDLGYMILAVAARNAGHRDAAHAYASKAQQLTLYGKPSTRCTSARDQVMAVGNRLSDRLDFCRRMNLARLERGYISAFGPKPAAPESVTESAETPKQAHAQAEREPKGGGTIQSMTSEQIAAWGAKNAADPQIRTEKPVPEGRTASNERKASDSQRAWLEGIVAEDSKVWAMNRYDARSMRDVTVLDVDPNGAATRITGNYTYNSGQKGWVVAEIDAGKLRCLRYWDFANVCRPQHDVAKFQAEMRRQEEIARASSAQGRAVRQPDQAAVEAARADCEARRESNAVWAWGLSGGFDGGLGAIGMGMLAAGPKCE